MRSLFRTLGAVALSALVTLIPAAGASAAKKPKPAAFAAKYHLKCAWRDGSCADDDLAAGDVLSDAAFEPDGGVTSLVDCVSRSRPSARSAGAPARRSP